MNKYFIIINLLCVSQFGVAQLEDNTWMFGYRFFDTSDSTFGTTQFGFLEDTLQVETYFTEPDIWTTYSSYSDENGALELYTNGMAIYNKDHQIIENGDSISYGEHWESRVYKPADGSSHYLGFPFENGAIFSKAGNTLRLFYGYDDPQLTSLWENLRYCSFEKTNKGYIVKEKDVDILEGDLSQQISITKHANGRDDWIIISNNDDSGIINILLATPDTVFLVNQQQFTSAPRGVGQTQFSPNGKYYARNAGDCFGDTCAQVLIFDFDRCNGILAKERVDTIGTFGIGVGLEFSENSQHLYVTNDHFLYQYDMEKEDVVENRRFIAVRNDSETTRFGYMKRGLDGKIYMNNLFGSSRLFHEIKFPNRKGKDCYLEEEAFSNPTNYRRTIPNFSNFRLGPIDGSPCDTLELDNLPIAKFNVVVDSFDAFLFNFNDLSYFNPTDWKWDFGDGFNSNMKEPIHQFDEQGIYNVCLTVSNENGEDQTCKKLYLGISNTTSAFLPQVKLFPNPTEANININIENFFPINSSITLFDMQGKKIFSEKKLQFGTNLIDLDHLQSGFYLYILFENDNIIKKGKLIKL